MRHHIKTLFLINKDIVVFYNLVKYVIHKVYYFETNLNMDWMFDNGFLKLD